MPVLSINRYSCMAGKSLTTKDTKYTKGKKGNFADVFPS